MNTLIMKTQFKDLVAQEIKRLEAIAFNQQEVSIAARVFQDSRRQGTLLMRQKRANWFMRLLGQK